MIRINMNKTTITIKTIKIINPKITIKKFKPKITIKPKIPQPSTGTHPVGTTPY